jgi:hypothetical protein
VSFGAGSFGEGLFGELPEFSSAQYVPMPPPPAILLDAGARDAVLDVLGRVVGMDPDDQLVALSFMIRRKSVKHAPEIGHDFFDMPPFTGARLQAAAERFAAAATPFDRLIASGRVTLVGVQASRPKPGETRFVVKYKKLGSSQVRSASVGTP